MVSFSEFYEQKGSNTYGIRPVVINPAHVVAIREDPQARSALMENRMPEGLSPNISFSRIYLNSGQMNLSVLVAGSPDVVQKTLVETKKVLKG
jgi:hypothetical protein